MRSRYIFIFCICILFSVSSLAQNHPNTQEDDGTRFFHEGSLMIKEGIPFLTVQGDSYEMGLQYGVLLNDMLVDMDHAVDSLIESYIGSFFLKHWIARLVLNSKIKKVEKTMPIEYVREMEGIAEGSDLKLKDLQIISYFPQLFFKISCTSFIMRSEEDLVHGRNLDWPGIEAITHHPLVVNYIKQDKIPVTVLTFVGYPGAYTAMNYHGLSMSINMNGAPAENGKEINDYNTGMPLAFKVRNILENTDDLQGVDQQFDTYSSHAWFIIVGSKKDNSGAIYELTRGKVLKNEMKNDLLFVENLSLSDLGRYAYSPIWMFGSFNISRERKMNELYERYDDKDLIQKSYNMLSNTENHHLKHDPFYSNSINNSMTVTSCIMDNMNNEIYFSYDERLAALNKYLEYKPESGKVTVYKEKQEIPDQEYLDGQLSYQMWYQENYSGKKKLKYEDYKKIIDQIKKSNLQLAYQAYLLSVYYSELQNHQLAYENAEKYISEMPDYYHAYYNKYKIMRDKGDYMDAIVALEEMLQTSTLTPYYKYLAKLDMIKMYDKLLEQKQDKIYIDKVNRLAQEVRLELNQYFIDKVTQKEFNLIQSIENKYHH